MSAVAVAGTAAPRLPTWRLAWRYHRSWRSTYVLTQTHVTDSPMYWAHLIRPVGWYPLIAWKTVPPESKHGRVRDFVQALLDPPLDVYWFWNNEDNKKVRAALPKIANPQSQAEFDEGVALYKAVCAKHRWFHVTDLDIQDAIYVYKKSIFTDPSTPLYRRSCWRRARAVSVTTRSPFFSTIVFRCLYYYAKKTAFLSHQLVIGLPPEGAPPSWKIREYIDDLRIQSLRRRPGSCPPAKQWHRSY